jgi:PleD family two-component response regulator
VVAQSDGEGRGATFTVTLPVALGVVPIDVMSRVIATNLPTTEAARLNGLRVLVTDDDPEALALASAILSRGGADVRTCLSAASAFDLTRTWRPDVLVADIEMPGEDGTRSFGGSALLARTRGAIRQRLL